MAAHSSYLLRIVGVRDGVWGGCPVMAVNMHTLGGHYSPWHFSTEKVRGEGVGLTEGRSAADPEKFLTRKRLQCLLSGRAREYAIFE